MAGTVTIKAILDTGAFSRSLDDMRRRLKALESGSIDKVDQAASKAAAGIDRAAASAQRAADSLKGVRGDALDGVAESAGEAASAVDGISGAVGDAGDSLGDVDDADKRLDWKGLEDGETAAQRLDGGFTVLKGTLANLAADGIAKAASAAKDMAAEVIDIGKGFESSMSNVEALSGASEEELDALEGKARELGATTTFSASQAADALGYMALAGWDAQEMLDGVGGALTLAQAGEMDLAASSDLITDYLSAFGMQAGETNRMVDVLAYSQANANTTVEGLGMAFKNCAANAHAAGLDVETTSAAISMMANQGLKGSEAGTAMNAMLRDMTDKMKDGSIEIGKNKVQVMDAQGNYRDFAAILADVERGTYGMGDAEKAAALQSTFTADSIKGINLLLNAGSGGLATFRDELYSSGGAAEALAGTMTDNLGGDLAAMNSALEETAIKVYDKVREPLRELVQFITSDMVPGIEWLVENFDEVAPHAAAVAGAIALIAARGKLVKSDAYQALVKELFRVEGASTGAATAAGRNAAAQKTAAAATKTTAGTVKASTVAMNAGRIAAAGMGAALKTIAPLAAMSILLEVLFAIGGAMDDAREHGEKYRAATKGLEDAQKSMGDSAQAAKDAFEDADVSVSEYAGSIDDLKSRVDEALESNAELADSLGDIFKAAGAEVGSLEGYESTIEELAGRSDLSAEQVAKLELAVQGVNEACGTTYEVAQDSEGAYQIMADGAAVAKDEILKLCDAQQLQIQLEANKEAYAEVWKDHAEKVQTAADAQAGYNDIVAKRDAGEDVGNQVKELRDALNDANAALESSERVLKSTTEAQTLYQMALDQGPGSMSRAVADNQSLTAALAGTGRSALDFASDMEAVGVSAEKIAGVNQSVAADIAAAYDGTFASVKQVLDDHAIVADEESERVQLAFEAMGLSIQDMGDNAAEKLPVVQETLASMVGDVEPTLMDVAAACRANGYAIPESLAQSIASSSGLPVEQVQLMADQMAVKASFTAAAEKAAAEGGEIPKTLAAEISANSGIPKDQVKAMIDAMALEFAGGDVEAATSLLGHELNAGLVSGIEGSADMPAAAVGTMSQATIDKARETFGVHSPSTVFAEIGANVDQGLAQGVAQSEGIVSAAMSTMLTNAVSKASEAAGQGTAGLSKALADSMTEAAQSTSAGVSGMKASVTKGMAEIVANMKTIDQGKAAMDAAFDSVVSKAQSSMSAATDAVRNAVGAMKSAMNFSWSLPHLKVPHVQVSGKFNLDPPSAPNFKVNWYATGGIFDRASIIGVGEAGREAVVPLTRPNLAPFAEAVAAEMGGGGTTVVNNYYIDGIQVDAESAMGRAVADVARALRMEQRSNARRGYGR